MRRETHESGDRAVHRRGRVLSALLVVLAAAAVPAQEPPGADVEELLALARELNPEYATLRYEAEAAAARIVPAGALADPRLQIELRDITRMGDRSPTLLPNRVGSTSYRLTQEIPWFGKRDLRREVAELDAIGAGNLAQGAWIDIAAAIKRTYAELYYLETDWLLSWEILDLMTRLERIALARYEGGLAAQQDVIRAQVEQTAMRNELITLEAERHHLQVRLNALIGRSPNAPLAPPERLRPLPAPARYEFDALADKAAMHNPLLAAAAARIGAVEKNRDLTYRNRYPDFTVGVTPIQQQSALKEWELMLEMNLPLRRAPRRAEEREAEALVSAAHSQHDATANRLLADLSEHVAALDAARRTDELVTDSLLPQAELTFQAALAGYETGAVDFATLLDAQRQISQAKLSRVRAQAEAQARLAEIERIVGEDL